MIRVVALTSGADVPSSRFRVRQYIRPLQERGILVSEKPLPFSKYASSSRRSVAHLLTAGKMIARLPGVAASWWADVTWLERELVPGRFTFEGFAGRPKLFDVDDALWLNGHSGFSERIASLCDGVIAGNEFLAEHYRRASRRVWVVPTAVDTDQWVPRSGAARPGWTIGWSGTAATLGYLAAIEEPLAEFLSQESSADLLVVCDRAPEFRRLAPGRWRFERWSAAREIELLQQMDVGLMPLPDSAWAKGKCALKMLLYMSVGIPVVVSPVGVNRDVLARGEVGLAAGSPAEWFSSLRRLFADRETAARMGSEGRRVVERFYSVRENADLLARIFREVAES